MYLFRVYGRMALHFKMGVNWLLRYFSLVEIVHLALVLPTIGAVQK